MSNRKIVEKEILGIIEMALPGSENPKIYQEMFDRYSDKEFEEWMDKLGKGEDYLCLYAPNLVGPMLTTRQIFKLADFLDYPLEQHITFTDPKTGQVYKTQNKHLVGMIPFRRQVQMLVKKSSIPDSNHIVDERTGQPTGDSKGARLSAPEIQVNASKGIHNMLVEMVKFRGGDTKAYDAMNRSIVETGEASMESIIPETRGVVKSTITLLVYLKSMGLDNNAI